MMGCEERPPDPDWQAVTKRLFWKHKLTECQVMRHYIGKKHGVLDRYVKETLAEVTCYSLPLASNRVTQMNFSFLTHLPFFSKGWCLTNKSESDIKGINLNKFSIKFSWTFELYNMVGFSGFGPLSLWLLISIYFRIVSHKCFVVKLAWKAKLSCLVVRIGEANMLKPEHEENKAKNWS